MNNLLRAVIVAGLVMYALEGGSNLRPVVPAKPYDGTLTKLHAASRDMSDANRDSLADTLDSAATMIASDKAAAIKTTDQLQAAIRATIGFGHTAFADQRYPAVATYIQLEMEKAVGSLSAQLTDDTRSRTAAALRECSKAVR